MDCRDFRRPHANRDRYPDETIGQDQKFGAQGNRQGGRAMMLNTHHPVALPLASYKAQHVKLTVEGKLATLTLNRPDRKNPLTFESYAEIGGNFRSGGDVFEIIGPLVEMDTVSLLKFTRMTGEAVKAMRAAPQTIVAAI